MAAGAPRLVIFDGDNTLWDTNEIFESAPKEMLGGLRAAGFPADLDRDFALLRRIDDRLISDFGGNHRYDIKYLAYSLVKHFRGDSDARDAISLAQLEREPEETRSLVSTLSEQFGSD